MRSVFIPSCFICFIAIGLSHLPANDQIALQEAVVAGWQRLDKLTQCTHCIRISTGPKRSRKDRLVVQGEAQKIETDTQVYMRNGDGQSYHLRKNQSGAWQVVHLSDSEARPVLENVAHLAKAAFTDMSDCLLDLIHDDNFSFTDWKKLENGLIEFKVKMSANTVQTDSGVSKSPEPSKYGSRTFQVDPNENCRIVRAVKMLPVNDGLTSTVKVEDSYDNKPYFPSKVVSIASFDNPRLKPIELVWEYTEISHDRLPSSEFTLAHYGLDEVLPGKPNYMLIAVIALVVLVGITYFSRKFLRS